MAKGKEALNRDFLSVAGGGDLVEVKRLLGQKVDVNLKGGALNLTAIMEAASNGHKEIVKVLIDAGAEVNAQDDLNNTALIEAAKKGHKSIVEMLLDAGANVNIQEKIRGNTAIIEAASNGHKETFEVLIKAGANINDINTISTLLIYAAKNGWEDKVTTFIDKGANIKTLNEALIEAAKNGHKEVVKILIGAGVDVNAKEDILNYTVIMEAANNGHKETVEVLIDAGADLTIKNNKGKTVLDIAKDNLHDTKGKEKAKNEEIIDLLENPHALDCLEESSGSSSEESSNNESGLADPILAVQESNPDESDEISELVGEVGNLEIADQ